MNADDGEASKKHAVIRVELEEAISAALEREENP